MVFNRPKVKLEKRITFMSLLELLYIQSLFSFVIGQNASDNSRYLEAVALCQLLTPSACNIIHFFGPTFCPRKYYCTLWLPSHGAVHCLLNGFAFFLTFEYIIKQLLHKFGFRMISRIIKALVCVIHLSLRVRWITQTSVLAILDIILNLIQQLFIIKHAN